MSMYRFIVELSPMHSTNDLDTRIFKCLEVLKERDRKAPNSGASKISSIDIFVIAELENKAICRTGQ